MILAAVKRSLCIAFIVLVVIACTARSDGYVIKGTVANAGNGLAVLVRAGDSKQTLGSDTVPMKNGIFRFTGKLETPEAVSIRLIPTGKENVQFSFIAENSPIRITADWNDLQEENGCFMLSSIKIEGSRNNDINEMLSNVYNEILELPEHKEYAEVKKKLSKLYKTDYKAFEELKAESNTLYQRYIKVVHARQLQLIRENTDVEAVGLTLEYLIFDMPFEQLEEIFNRLAPHVQQGPMMHKVKEVYTAQKRIQPGMLAPEFDLEQPDGSRLHLSSLRGKYVLLDFWGSWCRPCREAFPWMKKVYAEYKEKGLEILGVSNEANREQWLRALEQEQLPWKTVLDNYNTHRVINLYGIVSQPTLILIDPEGKIIGKLEGEGKVKSKLKEIFGE